MIIKWSIQFLLCVSLVIVPSIASANAYCSLRDPLAAINYLYPEATDHRSIVKIVDKDARNAVSTRLPFTLNFNELGKHTLYVALNEGAPIGLIHARSELSDWGIIEIAWALNLDLSINTFYIQRCRISACSDDNLKFLREYLRGKSFKQVINLLSPSGKNLDVDFPSKSKDISSLSLTIMQSALKTISVTQIVWKEDLEKINQLALVKKYIPDTGEIEIVLNDSPYISLSEIRNAIGYDSTYINFNSVKSFQVNKDKSTTLGYLLEAEWSVENYTGEFTWLISSKGKILAVQPKTDWSNKEIQSSFNSIVGQNIEAPSNCSTFAELAASELYFMSGVNR